MIFSANSKTFLIGEYGVLFGGCAVVVSTPPAFSLEVLPGSTELLDIDKNSPAGKFYNSHKGHFLNLSIRFIDPYKGTGGFGASSAQFVLLYKLLLYITQRNFDISSFLREYQQLASNGLIAPSGADCICQFYNHHIYFDSKNHHTQQISLDFKKMAFAIFKTKYKIPTHAHLQQLNTSLDTTNLQKETQKVVRGIQERNNDIIISGINAFFGELCSLNLVLPETKTIVNKFMHESYVFAAKGCGALGADTVIVFYANGNKEKVLSIGRELELTPFFS